MNDGFLTLRIQLFSQSSFVVLFFVFRISFYFVLETDIYTFSIDAGDSLSSKRSSLDRKSQSSFVDWASDAGSHTSPRFCEDDAGIEEDSVFNEKDTSGSSSTRRKLPLPNISLPRYLFKSPCIIFTFRALSNLTFLKRCFALLTTFYQYKARIL